MGQTTETTMGREQKKSPYLRRHTSLVAVKQSILYLGLRAMLSVGKWSVCRFSREIRSMEFVHIFAYVPVPIWRFHEGASAPARTRVRLLAAPHGKHGTSKSSKRDERRRRGVSDQHLRSATTQLSQAPNGRNKLATCTWGAWRSLMPTARRCQDRWVSITEGSIQ